MATAITATLLGQVAGPISLTTGDEQVTITFTNQITAFMLIGDATWYYESRASQSNSPSFAAGQSLSIESQSAQTFVFYARAATTAKLYVIFLG